VVMPIIDGLSREFKYSPGGVELVGFNTRLVDHGIALQKIHQFEGRTAVDPEPSPAMAGGLFSVHREYFFEIGTRTLSRCRCCFCCCFFFLLLLLLRFLLLLLIPLPLSPLPRYIAHPTPSSIVALTIPIIAFANHLVHMSTPAPSGAFDENMEHWGKSNAHD
jgi:hypothetical protein